MRELDAALAVPLPPLAERLLQEFGLRDAVARCRNLEILLELSGYPEIQCDGLAGLRLDQVVPGLASRGRLAFGEHPARRWRFRRHGLRHLPSFQLADSVDDVLGDLLGPLPERGERHLRDRPTLVAGAPIGGFLGKRAFEPGGARL